MTPPMLTGMTRKNAADDHAIRMKPRMTGKHDVPREHVGKEPDAQNDVADQETSDLDDEHQAP